MGDSSTRYNTELVKYLFGNSITNIEYSEKFGRACPKIFDEEI